MIEDILNKAKTQMNKAIEALRSELSKLRTGRAHPSLIEHLMVESYGTKMPLNQVANIATEGGQTLTVTPWDKAMIPVIEKAIMTSDLGLNPASAGMVIRVPLPPLTEERRRGLVKIVKDEGEQAKISVRNARREANEKTKQLLKEKQLTEDDQKRTEQQVQKLTDEAVKQIDAVVAEKEKDLMEI